MEAGTSQRGETGASPARLPLPRTSFVGRDLELSELERVVGSPPVLTLTGPGGCGKTRLGLALADLVRERFAAGVWWIDLAPVRDEGLVAATVAAALDVRPLPGFTELQAVSGYLAQREPTTSWVR